MRFELPNAVAAMNNAVAAVGDDGDAWEVIGTPLDRPVDEVLPEYDRKLELTLDPSAGTKRLEICGLNWGRITKDVARLNGLAAAIDNISGVVRSGKDQLAHDWKGEAYDAFRQAIEKVEKTLDDYSSAVRTTASGLESALTAIKDNYTTYRDDAAGTHLNFAEVSPPADWWKMSHDSGEFLAEHCTSYHGGVVSPLGDQNCCYNDDEQLGIINERFVNNRLFDRLETWDCTDDAGVVIDQYRTTVEDAREEKDLIVRKINNWYQATDLLKENVDLLFKESLDNLRIIAEAKPFATLSVPGASASADPGPGSTADPGPGGGGPGPSGGPSSSGDPGPSGGPGPSSSPPEGAPAHPSPEATLPPQPEPTPDTTQPNTVEIKDADRTIAVSSPDGEGNVKVTVEDPTGKTKTYTLDFNAASGMGSRPTDAEPQPADPNAEHVPAGSNGKCVIQDGPVTITAERSLFDEGAITITVDDGTIKPTTYTVDFTAENPTGTDPTPASPAPASAEAGLPTSSPAPATAAGSAEPARPTQSPDSASSTTPPDGTPETPTSTADAPSTQATPKPSTTDDPEATPADAPPAQSETTDATAPASDRPAPHSAIYAPPDEPPAASAAGQTSAIDSTSTGPATTPTSATSQPAAEHTAESTAAAAVPSTDPVAHSAVEAESAGTAASSTELADSAGDQVPTPAIGEAAQAEEWDGDPSGTLSGILVPEQSDGEAGIASAGADDPAGPVGAGMPMMAGAGGANAEAGDRAGTGWSVHGDLFDSADPVYSMHGVLGEDDLESQ